MNGERVHIRLKSQQEMVELVQALSLLEDAFSIENKTGVHRVNAKSVIGVMYTMFDFPDEMYLVNDTSGVIPPCAERFRMA